MLVDGIIESGLFSQASGVMYNDADSAASSLQRLYLTSAAGIVGDYLGYDVDPLNEGDDVAGEFMRVRITSGALAKIKNAVLRIAMLLQLEQGGNIGVSHGGESFETQRTFLNVVNYKPYLRPLSTLRLIGGAAGGGAA